MKEITKEEAKETFGEFTFFKTPLNSILIDKVVYLSGIPSFDERLDGKLFKSMGNALYISIRPNGFEVKWGMGGKSFRVCFHLQQLNYVVIEAKQQVFEKQSKSIVGRALIGGLLLGPVGAIVGGMTGIGDKKVKTEDFPDNILSLSITDDDGSIKVILFSVSDKNIKDVTKFFQYNFSDKLKNAEDIEIKEPNIKSEDLTIMSVSNELIKLKSLLDSGVLTQEEFNSQKTKLLQLN